MSHVLTKRQRAIYEFVVKRVRVQGIPPTLTEIARAFDLASVSGVADHLKAIERKGYIRRRPGMSRGIELLRVTASDRANGAAAATAVRVPVMGTVPVRRRLSRRRSAARRFLLLDGRVASDGAFAVRVGLRGLESRGILEGDYLIVRNGRAGERPRAGDLVVIQTARTATLAEMLGGGSGMRRLDNSEELGNGCEVLGRVIGVMRSMTLRKAGGPNDR